AGAAIVDIGLQVALAAVGGVAVAVPEARVAGGDLAVARGAAGRTIGDRPAHGATGAASEDIGQGDALAPGGGGAVAVAEARVAGGDLAVARGAAGRTIGDRPAHGATGAAIVDIGLQVALAAVGGVAVAVPEARVAGGDLAVARGATGRTIGDGPAHGATG